MYSTKEDITDLIAMIREIQAGSTSRNKNFFTISRSKKHNCYKRAKLFISLINDLDDTAQIAGNKIWISDELEHSEINLYNPKLKYKRRVVTTKEELKLLISQSEPLSNIEPEKENN